MDVNLHKNLTTTQRAEMTESGLAEHAWMAIPSRANVTETKQFPRRQLTT